MKIQTAVILAAGMGTRLKELGQSMPKGFLCLGERPIVEESIERLQACGIQQIVIVTGYKAEFYEQLKSRYPQVVTVHNPYYASSGSLYSLYCARQMLNQDFLLLESDLIYEIRSLEAVLAFPRDNVVLLSGQNQAGDEVFVETRGETIWAMSKQLTALSQPPTGELVGICKISQSLLQRMLSYAESQLEITLKVDYETDALVTVAQSYPVYYTLISDLLWTEIDDSNHLARAKTRIYPKISEQEATAQNTRLWRHKWGFKDTAFVIQPDRSIVMTGDRYPLSGCKLHDFLPYIEESFGVQFDIEQRQVELVRKAIAPPHKNNDFCTELAHLFSANHYSFDDEERLAHSHGQTSSEEIHKVLYSQLERTVDLVFYCESEKDAQTLLCLAQKHDVCLVPFGGGTNVSAALKLPKNETRMIVAVNLQRMNRIEWIDHENLRACVQAGITGAQLEEQLRKAGFTCGHEPDSIELSTLGGWIATNASGMKKNRYGNIEQIVENITMITPSGIFEQIKPLARASVGIQPQHLLFGSEGNLGLITKAVLKIHPLPEVQQYSSIIFPNFDLGLQYLKQLAHSGAIPASIRLVDNHQFRFAQALKPKAVGLKAWADKMSKFYALKVRGFDPNQMVAATIVFEGSPEEVAYQKAQIRQLANQHQGLIAGSSNGQRGYALTFAIAYIRDFLFSLHVIGETFETTVPWSQINQVCEAVEARLHQEHQHYNFPGKPYLSYRVTQLYHTSVCIYFTLGIYTKGIENPEDKVSAIDHALRQTILENGGSISHHHGVGKIRSEFLKETLSPASLEFLRQLKQNIDPNNIFGIRNNVFK